MLEGPFLEFEFGMEAIGLREAGVEVRIAVCDATDEALAKLLI
jgi:hypothetical protein